VNSAAGPKELTHLTGFQFSEVYDNDGLRAFNGTKSKAFGFF